jgi:hypothetical protein
MVGWFALRHLTVSGVLDRQSDPLAIGPFLQDLLHPLVRGVQRDIWLRVRLWPRRQCLRIIRDR